MQNIQKILMKRQKSQTASIVNFTNATRMETKPLMRKLRSLSPKKPVGGAMRLWFIMELARTALMLRTQAPSLRKTARATKRIPFNHFRERLESETSENWNREYVDYNGKVLRDAVLMDREQGNTFYSNKKEAEENAGAVARRDTSLPSYISSADSEQSENFLENQEEKAKHSKNFEEDAENADLGGDLPQGKGAPLVFKPILKPKLPLSKRFREGKVAGIGDIRRWVSEAMGINVNLEADAGADYNGVYSTPSDTIHLRSDNINSLRVLLIPSSLAAAVSTRFALVVLRRF